MDSVESGVMAQNISVFMTSIIQCVKIVDSSLHNSAIFFPINQRANRKAMDSSFIDGHIILAPRVYNG